MNAIAKVLSLVQKPVFSYIKSAHVTTKYLSMLNDRQILDTQLVKQVLEKPIQKRTITSQFGLWHKKQPKTGYQTCFSEKKSRRSWMVNTDWHRFKSSVLDREIHVRVSSKALRCIRKAGSFDNYILLTKAQDLDSIYGEYLRRLMLKKINDPTFDIPHIVKSRPKTYSRRAQRYAKCPPFVWHPPEIRHKDLTFMETKTPYNMNPRELRKLRVLEELQSKFEDIDPNHPLLEDEFEEDRLHEATLRKDGEAAMAKFKARKNKEKVRLTLKQVEENKLTAFDEE